MEGVKDRINDKHVFIPSKKTCWEIHLYLLEIPASVATPPAKRSLMSLRTTTTPSSSQLSPLITSPSSIAPIHHSPFSITIELIILLFVSLTLHLSWASWPSSRCGRGRGKEEVGWGLEGYGGDDICYRQESSSGKWWRWWQWWCWQWMMIFFLPLLSYTLLHSIDPVHYKWYNQSLAIGAPSTHTTLHPHDLPSYHHLWWIELWVVVDRATRRYFLDCNPSNILGVWIWKLGG